MVLLLRTSGTAVDVKDRRGIGRIHTSELPRAMAGYGHLPPEPGDESGQLDDLSEEARRELNVK